MTKFDTYALMTPAELLANEHYAIVYKKDGRPAEMISTFCSEDAARMRHKFFRGLECADEYHIVAIDHEGDNESVTDTVHALRADKDRLLSANEDLVTEVSSLRDRLSSLNTLVESHSDMIDAAESDAMAAQEESDRIHRLLRLVYEYVVNGVTQAEEGGFTGEMAALVRVVAYMQGIADGAGIDLG